MTFDELCAEYAETDSFMEPQITGPEHWWRLDGWDGTEFIDGTHALTPDDVSSTWNKIDSIDWITGYGARLSAPGYMDCTDWCVFDTEQEAIDYLVESYLE